MTQWPSSFFNYLFSETFFFLSYFICAFGFSWLSEWVFPWGILYPSVGSHCSLVQELGSLGLALVLMVPSDVPLMPLYLGSAF